MIYWLPGPSGGQAWLNGRLRPPCSERRNPLRFERGLGATVGFWVATCSGFVGLIARDSRGRLEFWARVRAGGRPHL